MPVCAHAKRVGCGPGRVGSLACLCECVSVEHGGVLVRVHRACVSGANLLASEEGAMSWFVVSSLRPVRVRARCERGQSGLDECSE